MVILSGCLRNYEKLVGNMLSAICDLGCKMSIKVHFLFNHLDKFPENVESVNDEQKEKIQQDFVAVEERYQADGIVICLQTTVGASSAIIRKNV